VLRDYAMKSCGEQVTDERRPEQHLLTTPKPNPPRTHGDTELHGENLLDRKANQQQTKNTETSREEHGEEEATKICAKNKEYTVINAVRVDMKIGSSGHRVIGKRRRAANLREKRRNSRLVIRRKNLNGWAGIDSGLWAGLLSLRQLN
jgi:hypothetical protein